MRSSAERVYRSSHIESQSLEWPTRDADVRSTSGKWQAT